MKNFLIKGLRLLGFLIIVTALTSTTLPTSYKKAESYVYAYANKSWYIPSSGEFAKLASENKAKRLKNITLKPGAYWTSTGLVTKMQIQSLQAFNTLTLELTTYSYKDAINGKVLLRVRPIRYFD